MPYITYSDLSTAVDHLDDLNHSNLSNEDWVAARIAEAEREINGRLAARYTVPFAAAPDLIIAIDMDLATYLCLRGNYTQEDGNVSEWVQEYYDRADKLLTQIQKGDVILNSPLSTIASSDGIQSSTTGVARTFSLGTRDSDGNTLTEGTLDWPA